MKLGTGSSFPAVTAEWVSLKAYSTWRLIKAVATSDTISLATRASLINLVVTLGSFLIPIRRGDIVTPADNHALSIAKEVTKVFKVVETYVSSFGKSRSDSYKVSETKALNVAKAISDLTGVVEQHKAGFSKPLYEQATVLIDSANAAIGKVLADSTGAHDQIDTKTVHKGLSESSSVSDAEARLLYKTREDSAAIVDAQYSYLSKYLVDTVNFTDDIDGTASIDDDQEVQFFKVISELTQTSDSFYRFVAFVRSYENVAAVADLAAIRADKPTNDAAAMGDMAAVLIDKGAADLVGYEDLYVFDLAKTIDDQPGIADTRSIEYEKPVKEAIDLVDTAANAVTKPSSDAFAITDDQVVSVNKSISDTITAFDILDQATIVIRREFQDTAILPETVSIYTHKPLADDPFIVGDIASVTAGKKVDELAFLSEMLYRSTNTSLVDNSFVSESKAISADKPTQDGFSLTDSGSLRSQSYCDFSYIAEDYVGEARTF